VIARRDLFKAAAAGSLILAAARSAQAAPPAHHEQRLAWWQEAKFGMFVHFGLYSLIGQHEWALEAEGIPLADYEKLAPHFKPRPDAPREWARLARKAGQKYMVLTTKHHEGFCLFDTKLTDYCLPRQPGGFDLVRSYVEAARAEGLKIGFYYSLPDWHHPDGGKWDDPAAWRRYLDYAQGQIRELMSNYGKIDILWYDTDGTTGPWEGEKLNDMVFGLQPDIIVNNRNGLDGDFSTPEQKIDPAVGKAWESCMTLNDSWGFNRGDHAWKTPREIVDNLATCARGGGNYLLNIGPMPDGTVPEPSVEILSEVGAWLERNGASIYGTERSDYASWHPSANFTHRGTTLYVHIYSWPEPTPAAQWLDFFQPAGVFGIGGLKTKAKSARFLASGQDIEFDQNERGLRLTGLPAAAPDQPVTVVAIECDGPIGLDHVSARKSWKRGRA
jgi:alpha-L-fucosidase